MFGKLRKGMNSILKKITIKELTEKDLEPIIKELTNLMIQNEVGVAAAEQIGKNLETELTSLEHARFKNATPVVKKALRSSIISVLDNPDVPEIDILAQIKEAKNENRPYIICMLGINGTGKTTTMAKLAKLFQKNKLSIVFAAGDTYRSGSIQQLGKHADNLGIRMIAHDYGGDPAAVAIDAIDHAESKGVDVVMIDTAGRMQNNVNLVRELEKVIRLSEPDLKIFVGDSLAGNDVIRQASQFNSDVGI
ncbi:MAG: signal recognition particle-docking protein FtsY, partial [Candidatus Heimdallarchaeota archaeon]|nr:signal recognition particle-docking protein FtsY [Candidatus Heimdallarchaeota archaeon]